MNVKKYCGHIGKVNDRNILIDILVILIEYMFNMFLCFHMHCLQYFYFVVAKNRHRKHIVTIQTCFVRYFI